MPIISAFCKKGGVGKTTFLGYLAHYYATQGKTVLVISADDQNSVFKIFGVDNFVTDHDDDFFEHLLVGQKQPQDITFEARINMYLMKTLNTDRFSLNLTLKRSEEKHLRTIIESFNKYFDYIFIDFPPSSSRLSEILLDISQSILIVVGLDTLGLQGFSNTIQYFVDTDIDLDKIRYIIPVGYIKGRRTPIKCLKELKEQAKNLTPSAKITAPIKDKAIIKNIQSDGLSIYDSEAIVKEKLEKFHYKNFEEIKKDLTDIYKDLNLD